MIFFFLALTSVKQSLAYLKVQEYCRKIKCWEKSQTNGSGTQSVLTVFGSDIVAEGSMQSRCVSSEVPLPCGEMGVVLFFFEDR